MSSFNWAYAKYTEGSHKDKRDIVSISQIDHNFNKVAFNKRAKYFMKDPSGARVKAQLIFVAVTKNELLTKIACAKRKDLAVKAGETASEHDEPPSQSNKNRKSADPKKKEERLQKYAAILNTNKEKLRQRLEENDSEVETQEANENDSNLLNRKRKAEESINERESFLKKSNMITPVFVDVSESSTNEQPVISDDEGYAAAGTMLKPKPSTLKNQSDTRPAVNILKRTEEQSSNTDGKIKKLEKDLKKSSRKIEDLHKRN